MFILLIFFMLQTNFLRPRAIEFSHSAGSSDASTDLALIGVSDVHDLIAWDYEPHGGGHRPVTLVLADDRTPEAIREALFAHRTVVWFKNLLLGRAPELSAVLGASLTLERASYLEETDVLEIEIERLGRARFYAHSHGPRKDVEFRPGVTPVPKPAESMTRV